MKSEFSGKWLVQVFDGITWETMQDADTREDARRFAAAECGGEYRIVRNQG